MMMKKIWLLTVVLLGLIGVAYAQFRFDNTTRVISMFSLTGTQLGAADRSGTYPLAVFVDKLDDLTRTRYHNRRLVPGRTYVATIIGEGGQAIRDIDLEIIDGNSRVLARDNDYDNVAIVSFTPSVQGEYFFKVTSASYGSRGDGFYSLVISAFTK
jgi:hypothetical protein